MIIAKEGINFHINIPMGVLVLVILILLICAILLCLYFRFNHFRKKVHFPLCSSAGGDIPGPREWEKQMQELADNHKNIQLIRYNFVLDDYNEIAYKKLNRIRNDISEITTDIIALVPAARWLFDNFQMMYREIKKIRSSGTSYEVLPILKSREYRGFPRVYILAKKMVAMSGGHLNEENIAIMLTAYQRTIPLTDKELWVLPEMLGFALLESIIELAEEIIHVIELKSKADHFVKAKLMGGRNGKNIDVLLCEPDENCKENASYHAHVVYLLKNMSFDDREIQRYMDNFCGSRGKQQNPSRLFIEEGKLEALLETNIRTLIVSLREINELDVEHFFEQYSYLEKTLSQDPEGVYTQMDTESRGIYRGVIVKLSLRYKIPEEKIVQDCLKLAEEGKEGVHCSKHVGYYLVGKGYPQLKAKVLGRPLNSVSRGNKSWKGFWYFTTMMAILLGSGYGLLMLMVKRQQELLWPIVAIIILIPVLFGIAIELVNFIFTRRIQVKRIPSLDYLNKDIPDRARTFVVMPVIISSVGQGVEYFNRLEKHYLANRQSNLYFAVLADLSDAPAERMPEDAVIEEALINRMKELNEKYPSEHQRFCLFMRYRKWNPAENCYMGWERKRGKLEEFNCLLNGARKEDTTFSTLLCDEKLLTTFRYVITLDADTNLIRDNAAKLVGAIDHPLNQPVLDKDNQAVEEGYVIIQPSVRNHIVDKNGSRFAEIFGGQSGLAHYSALISDIYQDIFNKAIYCGKGIYDVRAFHLLLHGTIPENRILSHDLLESCYAKTAFASTAKVMDNFPGSVISYAKREHRWIRGDWQLLPWLLKGRTANGRRLCSLSKWKIFDNMRRSLVPVSKTLFILINLIFLPEVLYLFLPLIFFTDLFNLIVLVISITVQKLFRPKLALVYKSLFEELGIMVERAFYELVLGPYRAYTTIDAIVRTLYRLLISKKNLLRWNTAESVDASIINTKKGYFLTMWSSLLPAAVILLALPLKRPALIGMALYLAIALLWIFAYRLAFGVSQPLKKFQPKENKEDVELLLETARRTWQYFKDFSTKENHWLCPDNYQKSHVEKVSDKTSPTNIGLQFLSILTARDMGFETLSSTVVMIDRLLDTVSKLIKWKGHLYNWYNIKTLEVLNPAYISTVDSGNFFGHLLALKNGLLEQLKAPILTKTQIDELLYQLRQSEYEAELKADYETVAQLVEDLTEIWDDLSGRELDKGENAQFIKNLKQQIELVIDEIGYFQLKGCKIRTCPSLMELAKENNKHAITMVDKIEELCKKMDGLFLNAEFQALYNNKRHLFHIGYHVSSRTLDQGCYDLIASESALTSFLAIAKGEVPLKHWHKLGRPLTMVKGIPCFVSWSGTMFEYLMPNLVMKEYEGSVYALTSRAAVLQQRNYAREAGIPWGISESQYYRFDLSANYQYKAFGVPKLRLQPVRSNSMVVTPYACMLALEYAGENGFSNLRRLMDLGMFGDYGFYEAIDYNHPDSVDMTPYCIVKSFMAHHQGMILVAINNFIHQGIMRKRFHEEPIIKAAEVLLEEKRQTHLISTAKRGYTIRTAKEEIKEETFCSRVINTVAPKDPIAHYLSNSKYSLMITSDGDGFSSYKNMMIYRWRADVYANTGNYIYIKDTTKNRVWSTTYHPTKTEPEEYQAIFSPHQAEFKRMDGDISTYTTVSLSPDHNLEIRRVKLTNHAAEQRSFEITSYLEVVGDTHLAEISHPAFNKLFIESEYLEEQRLFLSKRRSSKLKEQGYLMHMVKTGSKLTKKVEYENDRLKFIGRNHTTEDPVAVYESTALSNHSGFCNDPIMSLRVNITLAPGECACVSFITGVAESREEAVKISDELSMEYRIEDILEKFRRQSDMELKYLEINKAQWIAFQGLISPIFYPTRQFRGPEENIRRNTKNQSFLWRFGVSGDNPILLLRVKSMEEAGIIRDVLKAYEYLRINLVPVDLIILSDAKHGYMQELDDLVNDLTSSLRIYDADDSRPSLFMLHAYDMIPSEIDLLFTVARVVFSEKTGIYFPDFKDNMVMLNED